MESVPGDKAVEVHRTMGIFEANVIVGLLKANGIRCVLVTDSAGGNYPDIPPGCLILVRADQAAEARRLILEHEPATD